MKDLIEDLARFVNFLVYFEVFIVGFRDCLFIDIARLRGKEILISFLYYRDYNANFYFYGTI